MLEKCHSCMHTKAKLTDLIQHYEDLIATKDQEIISSHRIIRQLEHQLKALNQKLVTSGLANHEIEGRLSKLCSTQEQTIEYLKQREVKLIEQLKQNERQIFKLAKDKDDQESSLDMNDRVSDSHPYTTPKKQSIFSPIKPLPHNITLGKQNSQMSKMLLETSFQNRSADAIKLKVAEDQLKVLQIKHKMALLKCFQVTSLR